MAMSFDRRTLLRGALGGGAVTLGLPLLDCFLDGNGTALAAGGALPVRFGTWHWGCGMNAARWVPTRLGAGYDLPVELQPMAPFRDKINVLSGYSAVLDGKTNLPHVSGEIAVRTGTAPAKEGDCDAPTLDILIADAVGGGTRFRSLEIAATGNPQHSYSRRSASVFNPSEGSPLALYARLFGPEFQDPNAADFTPDPQVMVRKSVLSAVKEHRDAVVRQLGAADRARLDEFFTSLRQAETQLALQLERPPPAEACAVPGAPKDGPVGTEVGQVVANHAVMAQLLAMALACNQTRIFNMVFSDSISSLRRPGDSMIHHQRTHEEAIDEALGYQPISTSFVEVSMQGWATFVATLAGLREGAGTLLDNCLVFAHSDTQFAKVHSINGIPCMTAGSGGGRIRTGLHVSGNGDVITRVGLTLQQVMGVPVESWGTGSMRTSKAIGEILA